MEPSGSSIWRRSGREEGLGAGVRTGRSVIGFTSNLSMFTLQLKRSDVREGEESLRPRPGKEGGAPLEDRAIELPTVLGAREAPAEVLEKIVGGPCFPVRYNVYKSACYRLMAVERTGVGHHRRRRGRLGGRWKERFCALGAGAWHGDDVTGRSRFTFFSG